MSKKNQEIVDKYVNTLRERVIGVTFTPGEEEQDRPEGDFIALEEVSEGNDTGRTKAKSPPKAGDALEELMISNLGEIKDYYEISKDQASTSFALAVGACFFGLLLLFISAMSALKSGDMQASVVVAISGVVVELFAGTVLIVYNKSISQLNRYYDALRESEKVLYAANLVAKMSKGRRDDAYMEIIKDSLKDALPLAENDDEDDNNDDKDNDKE